MENTHLTTRNDALAIVHEYTTSESLRKHMLAVEAAMRAYATRFGEDPERWGLAGLLHDFDYERFPNAGHSATQEHPSAGVEILRGRGYPEDVLRAILGHAPYTGVPRDTLMAKTLFAVTSTLTNFHGTWNTSPTDSYLVGDGGSVLHFDGSNWLPLGVPISTAYRAIYGTAAQNVYVVGDKGVVLQGIGL